MSGGRSQRYQVPGNRSCMHCESPSITDLCGKCEARLAGQSSLVTDEKPAAIDESFAGALSPRNLRAKPTTRESFSFDVLSAREFAQLPEPHSELLLGPLIRRGERTLIVGDTGHGKTTLSLQLVAGILRGENVLGYVGAGVGPALWLGLEQGRRSIKRGLRESGLAERDDLLVVSAPDGLALDADEEHAAALRELVARWRPAVVLLDPYYKAHRADDGNAERPIVDLMRQLDALRAEHSFALLIPTHPRKDAPGRGGPRRLSLHDVAGSGAVTRGAEVVLAIERLSHGHARLRILKDRDGELEVGVAWPLLFDREGGFRIEPKEEVTEDVIEEHIRRRVAAGARLTIKEWATELGLRERRARDALDRLAAVGELKIVPGSSVGRSPRARLYGTAPDEWEQSGAMAQSRRGCEPIPLLPPSLEDGGSSGISRASRDEAGAVGEVDVSPAELERLETLAEEMERKPR